MFEKATRMHLRFETTKGMLSVEDLWDLPLQSATNKLNLDDMARALALQLQHANIGSFVEADKTDGVNILKMDILKHIIGVRLAERNAAQVAAVNRARKQHILAIIQGKENEQLAGMSLDELNKLVESM